MRPRVVKTDRQGLSDLRLRGDQFDFQAVGDFERLEFFIGWKWRRMIGQGVGALGTRVDCENEKRRRQADQDEPSPTGHGQFSTRTGVPAK